jgi:sec-independent protein translocase protein TatC
MTSPFKGASSTFNRFKTFMTEEPDDTPLVDVLSKSASNLEGVLEHIDALRKHLIRSMLAIAVTTVTSFIIAPKAIDLLAAPVGGITALTPIDVTEPIGVFMRVSLMLGFALALPYIAFEMWLFLAPGLSARARLTGLLSLPAVIGLFLLGASFAYFVMMPAAIPFLMGFLEMDAQIRPASYIGFATGIIFWIGLSFEFPLVIYILANIGLLRHKILLDQWRLAVVIIAVLAAAITPTIDPVNMTLVMGPLIVLYFFSIGLAAIAERRRK